MAVTSINAQTITDQQHISTPAKCCPKLTCLQLSQSSAANNITTTKPPSDIHIKVPNIQYTSTAFCGAKFFAFCLNLCATRSVVGERQEGCNRKKILTWSRVADSSTTYPFGTSLS